MATSVQDNAVVAEAATALPQDTWKPSTPERLLIATLCLISLMVALDATVIVTSLSTITHASNATATQGLWMGTSYLVASGSTLLFTASLSEILGRSPVLFASVLVFTVGTIVCCNAHSIGTMIAGRSIQGLGGGGIIVLCICIFADLMPLKLRPKWFGLIQLSWAFGTIAGPLIGGALGTASLWRWVFYIMFPFCAIGLVGVPLFVRLEPRKATLSEMLSRVDWFGGILFIPSAIGFLVALCWGGSQQPWGSWRTLVALIVGVAGLCGTVLWVWLGAKEPFIRRSIFHSTSSFIIYAISFVHGIILFGQEYYVAFFFLSVRLTTPVGAGIALLPVCLIMLPTAIVCGILISRTGHYRWTLWAGFAVLTASSGLLILLDYDLSTAGWVMIMVVLGTSHGLLLTSLVVCSQATAQHGDESAASAMYAFMRQFGTGVGVGVGGTIFQNVMKHRLLDMKLPEEIALESEGFIAILNQMCDTPQRQAIINAYVHGFRGVFAFLCALSGVAFCLSFLVKHYDLDRAMSSEHTMQEKKGGSRSDSNSQSTGAAMTSAAEHAGP